jgi:hypothetical protein
MRVTLDSTAQVVRMPADLEGVVPARLWEGVTDDGARIYAFIALVGVHKSASAEIQAEFARDLVEDPGLIARMNPLPPGSEPCP